MTKEQAVEIANSKWWKNKSNNEIVRFQLFEDLLCMPFGKFQQAIENVLERPVFTHEFADANNLRKEYLDKKGFGLSIWKN